MSVVEIEAIDAQGHAQPTLGHNVASMRLWVPAADAVELVEAIAPNGLHMLMASDVPAEGYTALPARDPGEDMVAYAERCRDLLP
ncbi:hypothetical protein D9M70_540980 [compost metagenome]